MSLECETQSTIQKLKHFVDDLKGFYKEAERYSGIKRWRIGGGIKRCTNPVGPVD